MQKQGYSVPSACSVEVLHCVSQEYECKERQKRHANTEGMLCVCYLFFTDRQDLEESEKVDILQEPMLEALKVRH